MAITNYLELKQAIQDWGKRTDALSHLDTFIAGAEADLWTSLKMRDMEARATATTNITDRFTALPTGFMKMRRLNIILDDGQECPLEYVDPMNIDIINSAGIPTRFTVQAEIGFNRVSDQAYALEMIYWKELTGLSAAAPTNALLTQHPMLYLHACMIQFYIWAKDPTAAEYTDQRLYKPYLARVNRQARQGRYGPTPASTVPGMVI